MGKLLSGRTAVPGAPSGRFFKVVIVSKFTSAIHQTPQVSVRDVIESQVLVGHVVHEHLSDRRHAQRAVLDGDGATSSP